jgi:ribose transport system ATP-binding protein
LEIKKGEIHSLVGENGAGKSTLANIIAGVLQADKGRVFLEGKETHFRSPKDAQRAGVGFVHQELMLCSHLSVAENVFIGHLPKKNNLIQRKELNRATKEVLELFKTNIRPDQKVGELGVAQQQIVQIAKVLSLNCRLVILDEPTSSLDEAEAKFLFQIIRKIKGKGIGVIYISHKLSEVFAISDRITVLRDGRKIATHNVNKIDTEKVIKEMVGQELGSLYPPKTTKTGKPLFQVKGFTYEPYFKNISFMLKEGEILGLAGLVGSGRTEIARSICGLNPSGKGEVIINGKKVKIRNYSDAIRYGLCYLTENRSLDGLFLNMSVVNNIISILLNKIAKNMMVPRKLSNEIALKFREKLNIKFTSSNQKVASLSGGNQQKVMIAKLLAIGPRILIMDEPTRGIDVGAKAEIHNMLRDLCNTGIGIIVISSEWPELVGLCDRLIIIHEGKLIGELSGDGVTQEGIIATISRSGIGEK